MEEKVRTQSFFRKYLSLILFIVFGYLIHVCVTPYLRIGEVAPNFLFVVISVVIVAYGKQRAFWVGCIYGILMETMLPSVRFLNLALYPLLTLFISFIFADKSQQRLAYERSMKKEVRSSRPLSRTAGCAAVITLVYEAVNVVYIFIGGTALSSVHIVRALTSVLMTSAITFVLMFPMRRMIFGHWDRITVRKKKIKIRTVV